MAEAIKTLATAIDNLGLKINAKINDIASGIDAINLGDVQAGGLTQGQLMVAQTALTKAGEKVETGTSMAIKQVNDEKKHIQQLNQGLS